MVLRKKAAYEVKTKLRQGHPALHQRQLHHTDLGIADFLEGFVKMKANMARCSITCMIIPFSLYSACSALEKVLIKA